MNIFVISLERAKERREKIKSRLEELDLDFVIIDAVDGQLLPESEKTRFIKNPMGWRDGEKFLPGEIGCLKSHIKAIETAKNLNLEDVIILEDDVILSDDFRKGVNFLMKIIPQTWQHIFLGGYIYLNSAPVFLPAVLPVNMKISGAYSYILRKSIYEKVLYKLRLMELPTDDVFEKMTFFEKEIESYVFFPFLTYPNIEESYIWGKKEPGKIHPSIKYFKNKI